MADRLFPVIQVGQVYLISRGSLKAANKRFSSVRNEYEINLDNNSQVMQVWLQAPGNGSKPFPLGHSRALASLAILVTAHTQTNDMNIPQILYHFVPIAQIDECAPNTTIGTALCQHRAARTAVLGSYQNRRSTMPGISHWQT